MPMLDGHPIAAFSRRHRLAVALAVVGVLASLYWIRGLPGLNDAPGWFYHSNQNLSLGPVFFALVVLLTPRAFAFARCEFADGRRWRALLVLMLLGAVAQFTLHFLLAEGLAQSFGRLFHGHGEFLRVAAAQRGKLLETLRDYDALLARGQLGAFAGSKPPGTLGFYMLIDALAQWRPITWLLSPLIDMTRASPFTTMIPESAALTLLLFPLLTYLTLAPIVVVGERLLGDARTGLEAALLYLTAPGILLIDLHLDGALYPLVATGSIALAVVGARDARATASIASGVLATSGVYCTYGLLPALGFSALFSAVAGYHTSFVVERDVARSTPARALRAFLPLLWLLVGAASTFALLVFVLKFQPIVRFEQSMAFHKAWKAGVPTALWRKLSLVEFGLYAGVPLMLALLLAGAVAIRGALRRELTLLSIWTLAVLALLLALAVEQGTNEVARIWLFTIPLIALAVAGFLRAGRASGDSDCRVLVATQAVLALFIKVRQPW